MALFRHIYIVMFLLNILDAVFKIVAYQGIF